MALNQVSCDEDGYLRIWHWSRLSTGDEYKASKCFAEQFYLSRAVRLWSGNNAGYVIIHNEVAINFGKNENHDLGDDPEIGTYVTFLKTY